MLGHQSPLRRRAMIGLVMAGGGFSPQFARPSYQEGVAGIGSFRGVPDVSADADPTLGPAIAVTGAGQRYIVHPAVIYRIGRSPAYRAAFHAVTAGTNTVHFGKETITGYQAAPGWNPVTGWGSPNAQVLIPLLVRSS